MTTVEMPQLGESVTEGTVLQWFKQPGDAVALDDPLCEIETEKVTAELPSPYAGTMGEILVPEGETVEVGVVLCRIEGAGASGPPDSQEVSPQRAEREQEPPRAEPNGQWSGGPMAIPPDEKPAPAATARSDEAPRRQASAVTALSSNPEPRSRFYSPAVLRLAAEHGLDLETIAGTGIDGRVTRRDVEKQIESPGAAPAATSGQPSVPAARPSADGQQAEPPRTAGADYEVVTLSPTRRTIAERMKQSNLEAPQAWTMVEADITGLVERRRREQPAAADAGVELTLLPYFTAAVVQALREFPSLNARWEGDELRRYHRFHIGIAVSSEAGLVVPVIHNAGDLNIIGLARQIADLAERARTRKLRIEDIEGGTFTVNNTGAFGSIVSKPIVNYPQVAIVTMERATQRPVVVDGDAIAIRWMLNVCLSFDHRALDGHEAGGFLAALKQRLEAAEM